MKESPTIEVIFRWPECEKALTIAVPSDNPLEDLKDTLQEVSHIPGFAVYFKGKILVAGQLSFRQHRMKSESVLDFKHCIRIYFWHALLQEVNPSLGVWFNERVGKVKMDLENIEEEFPDLPDEPKIGFPGVGGLSNDEMTFWGMQHWT